MLHTDTLAVAFMSAVKVSFTVSVFQIFELHCLIYTLTTLIS